MRVFLRTLSYILSLFWRESLVKSNFPISNFMFLITLQYFMFLIALQYSMLFLNSSVVSVVKEYMSRPVGVKNVSSKIRPNPLNMGEQLPDNTDYMYDHLSETRTKKYDRCVMFLPHTLLDVIDLKRGCDTRHDFILKVLMYTLIRRKTRHNYLELLDSMVERAREEASK